jgi:hypothetical protein
VHLRLVLPEQTTAGLLRPGRFVKVAVVVGEQERLLVPASSIVYRSEITAVYVQGSSGLQLRQVRLGNVFGNKVEVLAGIAEGEKVVVDAVAAGIAAAKTNTASQGSGESAKKETGHE